MVSLAYSGSERIWSLISPNILAVISVISQAIAQVDRSGKTLKNFAADVSLI